MDNLARLPRRTMHETTSQGAATVLSLDGETCIVLTEHGERRALRATSCLVAPRVGDEVLATTLADGRVFVLAVLTRDDAAVELRVAGPLRIAAEALDVDAARGTVRIGKLAVLASSVLAHAESARVAVKTLDSVCSRLTQTVKTCFRKVEELDQLRAERVDYRTEKEMTLRAENVLASARALVKVDGEQIHIG